MAKSILNRARTKEYVKHVVDEHRNGKFKRVGESFLDRIEARLKLVIHDEVHKHPSIGITLK